MKKTANEMILPDEVVMTKIYLIRGQKIMIDRDLAELYGVETKRLKEAVRRNITRFPDDFMFELTNEEFDYLRSQIASLKTGRGRHSKYLPFAFTEQGVSMLSSVLNSETAIQVSIRIVRVFIKMREMLLTHKDILLKLEAIERKLEGHDKDIALVFEYLKKLISPPATPRNRVGFRRKEEQS